MRDSSRARDYFWLAGQAEERDELDDAQEWFRESMAIFEEAHDPRSAGRCALELGRSARRRHDVAGARPWYEKSLALFESAEDRSGTASGLHGLGMVAEVERSFAAAKYYYQEALRVYTELGDNSGVQRSRQRLGWVVKGASTQRTDREKRNVMAFGFHRKSKSDLTRSQTGSGIPSGSDERPSSVHKPPPTTTAARASNTGIKDQALVLLDPLHPITSQRDVAKLNADGTQFDVLTLARAAARLKLTPEQQGHLLSVVPLSWVGVRAVGPDFAKRMGGAISDESGTVAAIDPVTNRILIMTGASQTAFDSIFVDMVTRVEMKSGNLSDGVRATLARAQAALPDLDGRDLVEAVALGRQAEFLRKIFLQARATDPTIDPAAVMPRPDIALIYDDGWPEIRRRILGTGR